MADITEKIVFEGDASQLQNAFEALVNQITRTREELKEYKNDKEKTAELTKKLADQEMALVKVMQQNDNVIDASNVSYRQLNDILKDLNKTYKATADEASRVNLAPSIKAINNELKGMDASIGNFQRNVGNYEGAINSAADSMSRSFINLAKTIPSLENGPEQFFMQLAQQIPSIISAYKSLKEARDAASVAASQDATAHRAEAGEAAESMEAHQAETTAVLQSAGSHLEEAEAVRDSARAEVEKAKATVVAAQAKKNDLVATQAKVQALMAEVTANVDLNASDKDLITVLTTLNKLKAQEKQLNIDIALASADLTAAEIGLTNAEKKLAAAEKVVEEQRKMQSAGGALKGLIKTLLSWQTVILVVIMTLAIFGKDIIKWAKNLSIFNDEAKKAARFQKEWNQYMREGHQNAAKQIVDLQIYSKWATMSTKSDKERTIAAKEVLKIMGSATTQTNIAKVKNNEFAESIDKVTEALIKQAQAEAMTAKITERYKEVIDAMEEQADAKARQQRNELDGIGAAQMAGRNISTGGLAPSAQDMGKAMDDALQGSVDRATKKLEKAQADFDQWLNKFLETFNPSELLFGKNGGSGGKGDNWFSKWELYIKEFEATLKKFQGEYEELDFASIWKYSAEGLKYYTKMYDEYIEHYKNDEKALREAQVNKQKYLNEFNEYHTKLQKQYLDSLKTELKVELDQLEEWHTVQVEIYKNAGEDTTGLEAEYTKRKQDILDKYVDKYKNALLERKALDLATSKTINEYNKAMMEVELANLDDTFKKELKEYERKGIETTNLVEHYAQESEKIVSKYAAEETKVVIDNLKKQEDARKRMNSVNTGYAMLLGNDASVKGESIFAAMGSTTVWGMERNKAELQGLEEEKKIYEESAKAQIEQMQKVLDSGKLVGQERLEMEAALADAQKELALGTLEYQLQIDQMRVDNAKAAFDEISGYLQQGFQGLSGIFDDVYTAVEKTMQVKVAEGKLTNEEAEKQLDEYRGIKAAAATMDALGSAVGAYNSLASIPYVGPALGIAAAAAALAAGMANVKLILATTKDNTGSGADSYVNAMPSLSDYQPQYVTNVTGKDDTDYLRNSLDEKPLRAFVVESDVTASQELATKRTNETTW